MGETKEDKVNVEGSNGTEKISFEFDKMGFREGLRNKIRHGSENYPYEQMALELMAKHNEFYGELNKVEDEYALRGAVLSCTHGNRYIRLDMCQDHGVYSQGIPVMTCNDYKIDENIFSFGLCGNSQYEPVYSETAPPPAETGVDKDGVVRHICCPILLEKWGYDIGVKRFNKLGNLYINESNMPSECLTEMQHGDEQGEEYVEALSTRDNLICLYSGVITIEENPEPEEEMIVEEDPEPEEEESLEWIPEEIMQLNGTTPREIALKKWIDATNNNCKSEELKWNQDKINKVWEACKDFYHEYGVQVDPRLMISIIGAEGTGSFNTNMVNKAADGQNGPQEIFAADLENAVDVVGGKVMSYAYYKDDFSAAREKAYQEGLAGIRDYDDVLHYINWETPRVSTISNEILIGNYAGNNNWNRDVRQIYGEIAFDGAAGKYTEYALSLGSDKLEEVTQKMGAEIQTVQFHAAKEGQDKEGKSNDEYVIKAKK